MVPAMAIHMDYGGRKESASRQVENNDRIGQMHVLEGGKWLKHVQN